MFAFFAAEYRSRWPLYTAALRWEINANRILRFLVYADFHQRLVCPMADVAGKK